LTRAARVRVLSSCPPASLRLANAASRPAPRAPSACRRSSIARAAVGTPASRSTAGTPSLLGTAQLRAVVDAARAAFACEPDLELTVEARVGDVDAARLDAWVAAGVTRSSLGVQSFDAVVRRGVGRRSDEEAILRALAVARAAGIPARIVDLIQGLPDQTPASFARDLAILDQSDATGVSLYPLVIMPGSALARRGHAPVDVEAAWRFHACALDAFDPARGHPRLRAFRRLGPGQRGDASADRCRYLFAQASEIDLLPVGAGAHGRVGSLVAMGGGDVDRWIAGASPTIVEHHPDVPRLNAALALCEGDGATRARLEDVVPTFAPHLDALIELRLVGARDGDGETLITTQAGDFWAGNVSAMLCATFAEERGG
jgi:coproporphyrinogen III oxidase-like Fe-S oxidoreductase